MDQLSTATSSEAVDRINQLIEKYGQALWNLQPSTNQQIGALSRQDVQNMMQQAETESQAKIAGWEQEVADDNAKLKQQIDDMTAALTSATGVASNVSDDLGDLGDATGHLHDRFVQAADALDVFIARANAASTAIAGWS
jgi:cytochrome c556